MGFTLSGKAHPFSPSVEIRCISLSSGKRNQCVAAVETSGKQVSTEHLHSDGSNLTSPENNKTERANALSVLLVRVSRFELEAS